MQFPVLLVVAANCLWKALGLWAWFWESYWKTEVEAWISRHVELYNITTCRALSVAEAPHFNIIRQPGYLVIGTGPPY